MTEEDTPTPDESEGREEEVKLDKPDFLQLIANALKVGTITSEQAKNMRAELGVFQGEFTGKQTSKDKRKKKRKAQAAARRVTIDKGYKGQKKHSGRLTGPRGR